MLYDDRGRGSEEGLKEILTLVNNYYTQDDFLILKDFLWSNNILSFNQTTESIIIAGFNSKTTPIVIPFYTLINLYIPLQGMPTSGILESFTNALITNDDQTCKTLLVQLLECIAREVPKKYCGNCWLEIQSYLCKHPKTQKCIAILRPYLQKNKPFSESTSTSIVLLDGTHVLEPEIWELCNTPEKLIEMLNNVDNHKTNFYQWKKLTSLTLLEMSEQQLIEIISRLIDYKRYGEDLIHLLERLAEIGDKKQVEDLCNKALKERKYYGWSTVYDGGSCSKIYSLMVKHLTDIRQDAFEKFINDSLENGNLLVYLPDDLSVYRKMFLTDVEVNELFPEVYEHLVQLKELSYPTFSAPTIKLNPCIDDDLTECFLAYIFQALKRPIPILRNKCFTLITLLNKHSDSYRQSILKNTNLLLEHIR